VQIAVVCEPVYEQRARRSSGHDLHDRRGVEDQHERSVAITTGADRRDDIRGIGAARP